MDPVVPSERKWNWGIIYYHLEVFLYFLRQWPWIHREWEIMGNPIKMDDSGVPPFWKPHMSFYAGTEYGKMLSTTENDMKETKYRMLE